MNSLDFLDAVRDRYDIPSYTKLAIFLRVDNGQVSAYKTGRRKLEPKMCRKVAELLEIDPGYVLASIQAERARCTEDREIWQRVASLVKVASTAAVLALVVFSVDVGDALPDLAYAGQCILCLIGCAYLVAVFHAKTARRAIAVCLVVALGSGCAASPTEIAWQSMHLVDVAQTINGPARDECFAEGNPITRALIGEQPSAEAVIAWGIGLGVAHYAIDRWLTKTGHADKAWVRTLRALDLGAKGVTIGRNHGIGIRPFGDNNCPLR